MSFQSRLLIKDEIVKTLENDNECKRIAICGMGGVGKTTLVKEIVTIVKANNLFDEIVMTVVSQSPDLSKMQGDIAGGIGLDELDRYNNVKTRASKLLKKLMDIKRILIILDDVSSDQLDLELIGLPSRDQNPGCKILLTSRNKEVCYRLGCQMKDIFVLTLLSKNEAWDLFKEMAGNLVDNPEINPVAQEIAQECGQLPLAIVIVAKALGDKEHKYIWEDALEQLKISSFPEMKRNVYSRIELSYNLLENEEAKRCLLLCCLFPEDYDISIEYLLRYGVGLGLFKGVPTLLSARHRVHSLVDKLKRCFLLLDSHREESIKMHDVVRDVVMSIAREKHGYTVCCDKEMKEWQNEDTWRCNNAVSIFAKEDEEIPNGLECPKLKLLQLHLPKTSIQYSFFLGMRQLMVASFLNLPNLSLPSSVQALHNLHTLCLDYYKLEDISVICSPTLKSLEILSIAYSKIKELPKQIKVLGNLKLLDLTGCNGLIRIPSGVLASLSRLEELYVRSRSFKWEYWNSEHSVNENNASLMELKSLSPSLRVLEIAIKKAELFPGDLIFEKLEKFWVYIGEAEYWALHPRIGYVAPNCLKVQEFIDSDQYQYSCKVNVGINQLINKSEFLELSLLRSKKFIYKEGGLPYLKDLFLSFCYQLEYLVDASDWKGPTCTPFPQLSSLKLRSHENLKEICRHGHVPDRTPCQCFVNLRTVGIWDCGTLRSVFTLMQVPSLGQLERLQIYECDKIEFIVSAKSSELDKEASCAIEFPNLVRLILFSLPRLIGFVEDVDHGGQSKTKVRTSDTHELVSESMPILSTDIGLLTLTYFHWFPRLDYLDVSSCDSIEVLFDFGGAEVVDDQAPYQKTLFPLLKEINVTLMNNLKHVWRINTNFAHKIQGFHNLTSLYISECHSLKYVFTTSVARLLTQLEKLKIEDCNMMETVVEEDGLLQNKEAAVIVMLPKLSYFKLERLPILWSIFPDHYHFRLLELKFFRLHNCPKLKTSSSEIQSVAKKVDVPSNTITSNKTPSKEECSQGFLRPTMACLVSKRKNKGTSDELDDRVNEEPKFSSSDTACCRISCHHLEELVVDRCDSCDAIFELAEKSDPSRPMFDCLKKISLSTLPNLISIWKTCTNGIIPQGFVGFLKLRELKITKCNNLESVLSPSMAKSLRQLQVLQVCDCQNMVDIVTKEDEKSIDEKKIIFHKLHQLELVDLPNLKSFHPGSTYDFELSYCESITIAKCPKIETFSNGRVSTPKLKKVQKTEDSSSDNLYMAFTGDLNSTIQQTYSLKNKVIREGNQGEVQASVGVSVPPPFARESMQLSETLVASTSNPEIHIPPPSSDDAEMQLTSTSSGTTPSIPATASTLTSADINYHEGENK
ncbi:Disease resistance protein [Quillaja saponaria]|uniref:Disease resistance protein n=1 Tax=Quillaja saponaria TaxID=32244 RepID=A0AAD7L3D0_QUISA|nr:Disease resistance protein [Quillaja saponaria]